MLNYKTKLRSIVFEAYVLNYGKNGEVNDEKLQEKIE